MTEKEKWYELDYRPEIEALEKRRDPDLRKPCHLKKSQLNCYDDCVRYSELEADWNWPNHWPLDENKEARTPEQVKLCIRFGKRIEFLFALQHKDDIKVMPTMYSIDHQDEYDMIFNNGDKYEVKSSRERAENHKKKHPDVIVAYPENSSNLNEQSKFVIMK